LVKSGENILKIERVMYNEFIIIQELEE